MNRLPFRTRTLIVACVGLVGAMVLAGLAIPLSRAAGGRTVWDGIYTDAQAERGQKVILETCSLCHGEAMRGGGGVPSAVGPEFMFNWNEKTVTQLFVYLKTTMPPTAPGSLPDQKIADAMAALFKHNGFPASAEAEIPADPGALADVAIVNKP